MKTTFKSSSVAVLALAIIGFSLAPFAPANGAPLGKAKGIYKGTISAKATGGIVGGITIPKTQGTLKLPRGKGGVVVKVTGAGKINGRVTKVKVRQGGKKVIQSGKLTVPGTNPVGLGAVTGPFKSVVTLGAGKPTVKATTTLNAGGATAKGVFKGSK